MYDKWPLPGETKKAKIALRLLPKEMRPFYGAEYALMGSRTGQFVGLACRCCHHWLECGHTDCPVSKFLRQKRNEDWRQACFRLGIAQQDKNGRYLWPGDREFVYK